MLLKYRINDDVDWWSFLEDEVEEINKGNVLFFNFGDDGVYKIFIKYDVDEYIGLLFLKVFFGKVFVGVGEDIMGGDFEFDDLDVILGEFMIFDSGSYEVKYKK